VAVAVLAVLEHLATLEAVAVAEVWVIGIVNLSLLDRLIQLL
jgi:hypothetical protein